MFKGVSKNLTRQTERAKSVSRRKKSWLSMRKKVHPFLMKNFRNKRFNADEKFGLETADEKHTSLANKVLERIEHEKYFINRAFQHLETQGHIEGKVTSVSRLGTFIDIGGAIGLVKISDFQLSASEGESITIRAMHIDQDNGRLYLTPQS